ncbi:hypothetical protein AAMO2058_000963500 [Amorphochlora amoebiformis]
MRARNLPTYLRNQEGSRMCVTLPHVTCFPGFFVRACERRKRGGGRVLGRKWAEIDSQVLYVLTGFASLAVGLFIAMDIPLRQQTMAGSRPPIRNSYPISAVPSRTCMECGRNFRMAIDLRRHIDLQHNKSRSYYCLMSGCDKSFRYPDDLRHHYLYTHAASSRQFTCEYCGLKSKQIDNHAKHLLTHSTDKPYNCSLCPRTFRQRSQLAVHLRETHNLDSRVFNCTVCSRPFNRKWNLKKHVRRHHPHSTFWREMKYAKPKNGRNANMSLSHAKITPNSTVTHEEEILQRCSKCGATFQFASSLRLHLSAVHNELVEPQFELSRQTIEIKGPTRKNWFCASCGMEFQRHIMFLKHRTTTRHKKLQLKIIEATSLRSPSAKSRLET